MIQQDIGELALGEYIAEHASQVRAQLIHGVRLARPRPQALNPLRQFGDHLLEQLLE
jgi:hypothetical protein